MNFPEATEVQLLLLNDTNVKDITPFTISTGNVAINVGSTGASTFSTYDTSQSPTSYTNHESSITGTSITYTDSVVIVRYKTTKPVITQVISYGFLKYNDENVWEVSNELQTVINGLISRIQTLESA
jgi:L-lactate permease